MKKNLKTCIEAALDSERRCLVDMNDYDLIGASGMTPELRHRRTAQMSGAWTLARTPRVRIPLGDSDLIGYRYLSLALYAVQGAGGEIVLSFESPTEEREGGAFECVLPIEKDGWNEYRIDLPSLAAVRGPKGWDAIRAVALDCVAGGVHNRPETVLYVDSMYLYEQRSPMYCRLPELKGAAVLACSGTYAIVDRKRVALTPDKDPEARPFVDGEGSVWLPMAPIAAVLAHAAVADNKALTLSFTYRRKKYSFRASVNCVTVDGEEHVLDFSPLARGGCLFFPMEYVRTFFRWRQCFTDPTGLIVLSNRKNVFSPETEGATIRRLVLDVTLDRPDGTQVLEDLHRCVPNPTRSRVLLPQEQLQALRKETKADAQLGAYVAMLRERYGKGSSHFAAAPISGDGVEDARALRAAFEVSAERLLAFATLYRSTGDKLYAERAANECEALAAFADWNVEDRRGDATVAFAVSVAYDWCNRCWGEGRKAVIERALLRNVLRPAVAIYEGRGLAWDPATAEGAEINAGYLAAALAMADLYPETVRRLLSGLLSNVETAFERFLPDGGYEESVEAWSRAVRGIGLTVAMLEAACGTSYGFSALPGIARTAYFPFLTGGRNGIWNYHGAREGVADTSILPYFSRRFADAGIAGLRRSQIAKGAQEVHPFDIVFYHPVQGESLHLPLDVVYRRAGLAVIRSGYGEEAQVIGLHAGSNHAPDGDLDVGGVFLEMGGERFFSETGGDAHLPLLLRRRAEGQNTLTVDPAPAPAPDQNPDAISRFLKTCSSEESAYAIVDMAPISDLLLRAERGVLLDEKRTRAVIQDECRFAAPTRVVWRAYTDAEVQVSASGRSVKLKKNGKTLLCRLCGVGAPARFEALPIEGSHWTVLRIDVEVKERLRMAVACRLVEENASFGMRLYEMRPMSAWGKEE